MSYADWVGGIGFMVMHLYITFRRFVAMENGEGGYGAWGFIVRAGLYGVHMLNNA